MAQGFRNRNKPFVVPDAFAQKFEAILGKEFPAFIKSLQFPLPKSLRVNTLKASNKQVRSFLINQKVRFRPIPFLKYAYWVDQFFERVSKSIEHGLGLFQIMSASSMIPPIVLNPSSKDRVLDLTSSPGNKTILLSQLMENQGTIIANELDGFRLKRLRMNLARASVANVLFTNLDAAKFDIGFKFDKVLLDSPCSSETEVNKDKLKLAKWTPGSALSFQKIQQKLILQGFDLLAKEGELVYATCAFSPEENEDIIQYLLDNRKSAETVSIQLPGLIDAKPLSAYNGKKYHQTVSNAVRIWPHKHNMQGFFICKIRST